MIVKVDTERKQIELVGPVVELTQDLKLKLLRLENIGYRVVIRVK